MQLGTFRFDPERLELVNRRGRVVDLPPHAARLLALMCQVPGRIIPAETLRAQIWPGIADNETALARAVGDIRKALGVEGREILETVPREGYRLVPDPAGVPLRKWLPLAAGVLIFGSVMTVLLGMQIVSRDGASGSPPTVVVQPVEVIGDDPDWAPQAEAAMAVLSGAVAERPGWTVLPDGSAPRYRLSGSLLPRGDQVMLRMELREVETDRAAWSGEWVRTGARFGTMLDEAAAELERALDRRTP